MKKNKKWKKIMMIVLGCVLILVGAIIVWFNIPFSPLKKEYRSDINELKEIYALNNKGECFTEEDFKEYPELLQKYVRNAGYIGTSKMSYMNIEFKDVAFKQGRSGPNISIDYTQYNFAKEPCRMALIDSTMFGTPFEGYDSYRDGRGDMKGVVGKLITIFDVDGEEMDKACLATYLAEILFVPSAILQNDVSFDDIGNNQLKATITCKNVTASGIFTFSDEGEMQTFVTDDRAVQGTDGSIEHVKWTAICSGYRCDENGVKQPSVFKAVWNYPDEDFIYFDGDISSFSYGY